MVSVIVPVYNVDKYLEECLASLEKQTLQDIEIIIVNDGSTDNSKQICLKYANRPHFTYYEKENGGLMSAYLFGVEKSKGNYIGFVDSDDYVAENMFERMFEIAQKYKCDIVMCGRNRVYKNRILSVSDGETKFYDTSIINQIYERALPSLQGGDISPARWNKLFKRDVFLENIKYCSKKSRYMEDRFIVPACLFSSKSFALIDDPLYFYRVRRNSNSKGQNNNILDTIDDIYNTQSAMLKDKGLYEKYSSHLERALLNYWKVAIERNVIVSKRGQGFSTCKILLNKRNRRFIIVHKQDCVFKFGKCLYWAAKLNMPILLYFFAKLSKHNYLIEKDCFD